MALFTQSLQVLSQLRGALSARKQQVLTKCFLNKHLDTWKVEMVFSSGVHPLQGPAVSLGQGNYL